MPAKPTITDLSLNCQAQIESIQQLHRNSVKYHKDLVDKRNDDHDALITYFENTKNKNKAYKDSCSALRNDVLTNYHTYYMSDDQFRNIANPRYTTNENYPILRDIVKRTYIYRRWPLLLDEYNTTYNNRQADTMIYEIADLANYDQWFNTLGKTENDEDEPSSIHGHPIESRYYDAIKDPNSSTRNKIYKEYNLTTTNYVNLPNKRAKYYYLNTVPTYLDNYCILFYPKSEVIEQPVSGISNRTTYKSKTGNKTISQKYIPVFSFNANTYITQYNSMKITTNTLPYYVNRYQENVVHQLSHLHLTQNFKTKLVNTMNTLSCQTYIKQNKDITKLTYNVNLANALNDISVYQKSNFTEIKNAHDTLSAYIANVYVYVDANNKTENIIEIFKNTIQTIYREYKNSFPPININGAYQKYKSGYTNQFNNIKNGFTFDNYFTNQ